MPLILILIAIIVILRLPSVKGKMGEKRVASRLKRLPEDRYKVINNLLITNGQYTSQIDHVVVSVYGVFVIETKTYKGWIYGGEESEYWTQNIYGNKYKLRNPIHQNYGHIKALKNVLKDYPPLPYVSIVAFSRNARIGVSSSTPVIYWDQILSVISQFGNRVLTEGQVSDVANSLLRSNKDSKESRKAHVSSVKTQVPRRKEMISNRICPRCGGTLLIRQGKYGSFYGCSNYPKCRYTYNG
jgi:hypothetical protein